MATALEVGLVSGFALQDGDRLAELIGGGAGGGGLSLGNAASTNVDLTSSSNNNIVGATQVVAAVTIVTTATATGNSLQLAPVGVWGTLRIFNRSTVIINIFPPTNQSVDLAAVGGQVPVNGSVSLQPGAQCDYVYIGNNQWISDLLGSSSV